MDKIYEDFTTKLLPSIQEGLVITKDYFFDLFQRDIKYLIVTDSIGLGVAVIVLIAGIWALYKAVKAPRTGHKWLDGDQDYGTAKTVYLFSGIAGILIGFTVICINTSNLIKDIYLPELRVYEQIRTIKNPI